MSCFTRVATQLADAQAIQEAAKQLGYPLREGTTVRGWSSQTAQADFVLGTSGAYDIGAVRREDGSFEFVCDWSMSGNDQDAFVSRLAQRYAYVRVMATAQRNRFNVAREEVDAQGNVKLVLRRFV